MTERRVVIAAYGRSAVCKSKKGSFAHTHPIEWSAQVLQGVLKKLPQLDPMLIDDIVVGCSQPTLNCGNNIGRMIGLRAGLPEECSGMTVNRFCASGLQAVADCANAIIAGQADIMIAGGLENMTGTFGVWDESWNDPWFFDNCPGAYMSMGITAENVAKHYSITRKMQDEFSVKSHKKAAEAQSKGYLNMSIIPVKAVDADGKELNVEYDEGIRPNSNMETLSQLNPCFLEGGTVTAASSSQTSDAAAFCILLTEEKARELGIEPIAFFKGFNVAGCDPTEMGLGPMYAVPKLLKRLNVKSAEIDVMEINEAFAAQSIPCVKAIGIDEEKVNPWGGAIALGHPMGATGIFLITKALDYLKVTNGKTALVTMCIGGGMGAAALFEMYQ